MKTAVVSSSAIGRYNRMDAAFHIAVATVADQAQVLETELRREGVVEALTSLSTADLACLEPLTRGQDHSRKALIRAIEEYPYLAYALVLQNIQDIEKKALAEVAGAQLYADHVASLKR